MQVLEVLPVGFRIVVVYSLEDLKHLKTIMDNMTFNMDGGDPTHKAANDYLHSRFYPELADTLKELLPNVAASNPE